MPFVQTASNTGAFPSVVTTFGSNTTSSDLIFVAISDDSNSTTEVGSVTDNKSNTYAQIGTPRLVGTGPTLSLYYAQNINGGSGHALTVNLNGSSSNCGVVAQEFNSIVTTGVLDVSTGATGTSTSPASGSTGSTSQASELVVGAVAFAGAASAATLGSGYSNLGSAQVSPANAGMESKVVSAIGTQSATFTITSANWACACVTFKAVIPGSMPTFTDGTVPVAASFNTLGTGIKNLSNYLLGAYAVGTNPPRTYIPQVRVSLVSQIVNATYATLNWTHVDTDNDNMFSSTLPGQVTIRTAGTYALRAEWRWGTDATPTGDRLMIACYNGTTPVTNGVGLDMQHWAREFTDGPIMHISTLLPGCVAGAPVALLVWHNDTTTSQNSNSVALPYLSLWRIGP